MTMNFSFLLQTYLNEGTFKNPGKTAVTDGNRTLSYRDLSVLSNKIAHVLRAMGVPFTAAHGSVRFSLSRYTTPAEIETVMEKLPPVIHRLRELSPFVAKD